MLADCDLNWLSENVDKDLAEEPFLSENEDKDLAEKPFLAVRRIASRSRIENYVDA